MVSNKSEEFYEQKYRNETEPWGYSGYAVEMLRYELIVKTAKSLKSNYTRVLDVGCSKGQLTFLLNGIAPEVIGIDVSKTAVNHAALNAKNSSSKDNPTKFIFAVKNILNADFPDNHFDLILLCDGIEEWFSDEKEKMAALRKTNQLLKPGGYAILSDYQKPQHFASFVNFITHSPLKVVKSFPLNDRLCYQFNSWFKMGEKLKIAKQLFANKTIAKGLMGISSLLGKNGSKHFCVVVQKMLTSTFEKDI